MRIAFTGSTNDDFIWVNAITFELKDGSLIDVDRCRTEYFVDKGKYEMVWKACYTWTRSRHDFELSAKMFEGAKILDFAISDAAPDDYEFDISFWKAFDS